MKIKVIAFMLVVLSLILSTASAGAAPSAGGGVGGFDEFGYNRTARIFNGTGRSWCQAQGWSEAYCLAYVGWSFIDAKLIMNWNKEWDRGMGENWSNPPYAAWESVAWIGSYNGSSLIDRYTVVWVGDCVANPTLVPPGGACVPRYRVLAMIMHQGNLPGYSHIWYVHATPSGRGSYR